MDMTANPRAAGSDVGQLERTDVHFTDAHVEPGKVAGSQIIVDRGGRVAYLGPTASALVSSMIVRRDVSE